MANSNKNSLIEKIKKRKTKISKLQEQLNKEKKALKIDEKQLEALEYNSVIEVLAHSNLSTETVIHLIQQEQQKRQSVEGELGNEKNY